MSIPKIWRVATLNVQAGLTTHRYRDYLTQSWHHVSPTATHKHKNLMDICQSVQHLDVFGVQEIDPGSWRSGFRNQALILAQNGGFDHWSCQSNRSTGVSITANGLFSKTPLDQVEHWTLPTRKSAPAPRGAVHAKFLDEHGHHWTGVVAHFSLNAQDRLSQASFLAERLAGEKNLLIMGDFNDLPTSKSLAPLAKIVDGYTDLPTYPRWSPQRAIDVVWWKDLDIREHTAQCWGGTDHCGVEIAFQVPPKTRKKSG